MGKSIKTLRKNLVSAPKNPDIKKLRIQLLPPNHKFSDGEKGILWYRIPLSDLVAKQSQLKYQTRTKGRVKLPQSRSRSTNIKGSGEKAREEEGEEEGKDDEDEDEDDEEKEGEDKDDEEKEESWIAVPWENLQKSQKQKLTSIEDFRIPSSVTHIGGGELLLMMQHTRGFKFDKDTNKHIVREQRWTAMFTKSEISQTTEKNQVNVWHTIMNSIGLQNREDGIQLNKSITDEVRRRLQILLKQNKQKLIEQSLLIPKGNNEYILISDSDSDDDENSDGEGDGNGDGGNDGFQDSHGNDDDKINSTKRLKLDVRDNKAREAHTAYKKMKLLNEIHHFYMTTKDKEDLIRQIDPTGEIVHSFCGLPSKSRLGSSDEIDINPDIEDSKVTATIKQLISPTQQSMTAGFRRSSSKLSILDTIDENSPSQQNNHIQNADGGEETSNAPSGTSGISSPDALALDMANAFAPRAKRNRNGKDKKVE